MHEKEKNLKKLSSHVIHKNPYFTVVQDAIIRPNGKEGITRVLKVQFKEVLKKIKRGEITDSETIIALMMASIELGLIS
jgi:hypothetical protein